MYSGYTPEQIALVKQEIPQEFISRMDQGRKHFNYVEYAYVQELLNRIFGYNWSIAVKEHKVYDTGIINDKTKTTKKFVSVLVALTVPVTDPDDPSHHIYITKESFGGHAMNGTDAETLSQTFKVATSDAIKKAASMLGIAQDIYMGEDSFRKLKEMDAADDWTELTRNTFSSQFNAMAEFAKTHPDYENVVKEFCDETKQYTTYGKITPSNIIAFLDWLHRKEDTGNDTVIRQPKIVTAPNIIAPPC